MLTRDMKNPPILSSARMLRPARLSLARGLFFFAMAILPVSVQAQQSVARQWNEELLGAIRRDVPHPPAHARNLFHLAAGMYTVWSAYDLMAVGYSYNEKVVPLPVNVEAARHEAISYAAYKILRSRFASSAGAVTSLASFNNRLTALGYSTTVAQAATTSANTPAELGKRVADAILNWGVADGFSGTAYPQAYTAAVNSNVGAPMSVLGANFGPPGQGAQTNVPLGFGVPSFTNPNLWQPLSLSSSVSQNGIVTPAGTQAFVGVQGLSTQAFSLKRDNPIRPYLDPHNGPSLMSFGTFVSNSDAAFKESAMDVLRASSQLNSTAFIDISPKAIGDNTLGADDGNGYTINPITGNPYTSNFVQKGNFVRVLAEYWADGPNSETPPGHWHVLANEIADGGQLVKKIGGTGAVVNDLEWDVKMYFAMAGSVHDAACAAWSLKRFYSGARPITMIRYMGSRGQSSDPFLPSYSPEGLPLEAGVAELITAASSAPGQRHANILDLYYGIEMPGTDYIGQVAIFSWPGEHPNNAPAPSVAANQSMVRWMLAKDWLPFQRKTFNTPAFPGYVSGHSTFSRAAAEVMARITGSIYFPGGFHHKVILANSLQIDRGPSFNVDLQWATYYDAADQAGQSRRHGGIHVSEDDYHGREIGALAGVQAYNLAEKYWTGSVVNDPISINLTRLANGSVKLDWVSLRGLHHRVYSSTDMITWTPESPSTLAVDTHGTWTDTATAGPKKFYRIKRSTDTIP
jgi:hypothetical protein